MRAAAIAIVAAGLVAATMPAIAYAGEGREHGYQTWLSTTVQGSIASRLWLWTDLHLRMYADVHPSAILLRPGLTLRATQTLFLTAGYANTPSWTQDRTFTNEHRAWQQIMWTPKHAGTGVGGLFRGRLEQRFRPDVDDDTGLRVRALLRAQVPVSRKLPLFFVVWDELFFGLNDTDWGQRRGPDQNRLFAGVAWQIAPRSIRMELGYTNVTLVRSGPNPMSHVLALNTFVGWPQR